MKMKVESFVLRLLMFSTGFGAVLHFATAQSYSPMYAPASTISGGYQCLDQYNNPIPYPYFTVNPAVYLYTNGHMHDDPSHLYSSVSPTSGYGDANGVFNLSLTTSLVGQAEALLITCSNGVGTLYAYANYAVGYNDLYYNDHPDIWVKIGGSDTGGGSNHGTTAYNRYMQSTPAYGLYYATEDYLSVNPGISKICTNDMALPFGGKFDICNQLFPGCKAVTPWQKPHSQHDRGTAADVAAVGYNQQCASAGGSGVNVSQFIAYCVENGASSTYSFNEGNHAHCGFSVPTWPH